MFQKKLENIQNNMGIGGVVAETLSKYYELALSEQDNAIHLGQIAQHIRRYFGMDLFLRITNNGYLKEPQLSSLWLCFEALVSSEQKSVYLRNSAKSCCFCRNISYEKLLLNFYEYEEDDYFIYDKNSHQVREENIPHSIYLQDKHFKKAIYFSDLCVYENESLLPIRQLMSDVNCQDKLIYVISDNLSVLLSYLKVISFEEAQRLRFFDSIESFKRYFLENAEIYKPIVPEGWVFGAQQIFQALKEIHLQRISYNNGLQHQNDTLPLLTVAITTYNRGHLALRSVTKLRETFYDSELEIMVSDNCSTKTQEAYQQIALMKDSRVSYYRNKENGGYFKNIFHCLDRAKGQFCLFLSDEDIVNIEKLPIYLELLKRNPDVAYIRSSGNYLITGEPYNRFTYARLCPGIEAALGLFLAGTYASGNCFNVSLIRKEAVLTKYYEQKPFLIENAPYNCKYYEQVLLESFFCVHYPCIRDETPIFLLGDLEEPTEYTENGIPKYAIYDNRICQYVEMLRVYYYWFSFDFTGFRKIFLLCCNLFYKHTLSYYVVPTFKQYGREGMDADYLETVISWMDPYYNNASPEIVKEDIEQLKQYHTLLLEKVQKVKNEG